MSCDSLSFFTFSAHRYLGYEGGSGNVNATALVESLNGHAVVASTNYRLNVYGFLGGDELRSRDPERNTTGNYGMQDQRAALR